MERQGGGLEGVQRQAGDACGDFISHPRTGLNMLPRSYKSVMVDGPFDVFSLTAHLKSEQ